MDECLELADWNGFASAPQGRVEKAGKLRGRGFATSIEQAGIFNDRMELRFDPSGNVTILAGTHSHGQGHATVFAQMVSEWLGVPFEASAIVQGDTDAGRRSAAAPTPRAACMVGGNALQARRRRDHREGEADGRHPDGGRRRRHRVRGRQLHASPAPTGRCRSPTSPRPSSAPAGPPPQFGLGLEAAGSFWRQRAAELSQRLPRLRGRDRSGDRRGRDRALRRGRRRRP